MSGKGRECQNAGRINRVRGFPEIQEEQDQNIVLCCLLSPVLFAISQAGFFKGPPFFWRGGGVWGETIQMFSASLLMDLVTRWPIVDTNSVGPSKLPAVVLSTGSLCVVPGEEWTSNGLSPESSSFPKYWEFPFLTLLPYIETNILSSNMITSLRRTCFWSLLSLYFCKSVLVSEWTRQTMEQHEKKYHIIYLILLYIQEIEKCFLKTTKV